ncbi:hypothetical protein Hsar01_04080 [Haloferula sargassicola]|uniref:Uncharacterized protein n=1 Tax=Haloferula sargassicola TaxID=490096 RepID=A0ABP9UTH9_9BACT
MSSLVLYYCDANTLFLKNSEEDNIGKSSHQCATEISTNDHPTLRHGSDLDDLPLKFIHEVLSEVW